MSAPWTEAHRREALRRTYEIAAELIGVGLPGLAQGAAEQVPHRCRSENEWRDVVLFGAGLDPARIDREVRRVRGLAEGGLVREVFYGIRMNGETVVYRRPDREAASASRRGAGGADACRLVHVTRIRRAP